MVGDTPWLYRCIARRLMEDYAFISRNLCPGKEKLAIDRKRQIRKYCSFSFFFFQQAEICWGRGGFLKILVYFSVISVYCCVSLYAEYLARGPSLYRQMQCYHNTKLFYKYNSIFKACRRPSSIKIRRDCLLPLLLYLHYPCQPVENWKQRPYHSKMEPLSRFTEMAGEATVVAPDSPYLRHIPQPRKRPILPPCFVYAVTPTTSDDAQ